MVEVLTFIALGLIVLCAVFGWTFVALYSRVQWWRTAEGRHLMKFTTVLSLTYTLTLLFHVVEPKMLTRLVLSIALFGWTAYELGNRIVLHLRAKREHEAAVAEDHARHVG
jgi:hypothetical protein